MENLGGVRKRGAQGFGCKRRVVLEHLRRVRGTIIEDRGKIGFKGAHLYAIRFKRTSAEDMIVELPSEEFRAA